ncbi:hypothetical protein [Alteraurantiacibacter aquimixticola]|uniref:Uncharacterized protein n=1 Tax=Alteraurantiacibacter aquimixticola TaxID=2489173 RepID=A0A4T3F3U4_9SPHN|nr:hypothetical protein [Alteraurantiacibacter aquimixticola]TIX51956.1 hypothetical protein E5222_05855 [Alteraurantiacibacter aquimixticola]
MSDRFRLPLPERLPAHFSPAILALVLIIISWSAFTSGREPEGCYRINDEAYLAVSSDRIRLQQEGRALETTNILQTDRVRGYVLYLDRQLAFDPNKRLWRFMENGDRPSLFINGQIGQASHIPFHPKSGGSLKFFEFDCDTAS